MFNFSIPKSKPIKAGDGNKPEKELKSSLVNDMANLYDYGVYGLIAYVHIKPYRLSDKQTQYY